MLLVTLAVQCQIMRWSVNDATKRVWKELFVARLGLLSHTPPGGTEKSQNIGQWSV